MSGVGASDASAKSKPVVLEKQVPAVEAVLKARLEEGVESIEPSKDDVAGDGLFEPQFVQKLQDLEVVEGSAARFDVTVKGM